MSLSKRTEHELQAYRKMLHNRKEHCLVQLAAIKEEMARIDWKYINADQTEAEEYCRECGSVGDYRYCCYDGHF